jgi:hypothetical protein
MEDGLDQSLANSFVLGLLVAEELRRSPSNSTADQEAALLDIMLGLADGTRSMAPDDLRVLQLLYPSADAAMARDLVQKTALQLVEWYRQKFFC